MQRPLRRLPGSCGIRSRRLLTPELSTDWEDNNAYWRALESPVEEAAAQTFDTFLKSNGQDLGIQSYGACVDLLVTWFGDEAGAF